MSERTDCWCAGNRNPCGYHEGWDDAIDYLDFDPAPIRSYDGLVLVGLLGASAAMVVLTIIGAVTVVRWLV